MKHVLSIQDLSCVGRCSLTVALPVLSAMGIRCSVLPTAVFSTHTAFPEPETVSLTDSMEKFADHWIRHGISFDAVSVGYLSDPRQAEAVAKILEEFGSFTVLDPVMGDHGRLYSRITPEHIAAMKGLCAGADVILPNLTEAAALTGLPYREKLEESYLEALTAGLLELGAKAAVITGIHWQDQAIGFYGREDKGQAFSYQGEHIPRNFHGTGDLFAAVVTGCLAQGLPLPRAAEKAAEFVKRCVENTKEVTPHGVEFESQLRWLGDIGSPSGRAVSEAD